MIRRDLELQISKNCSWWWKANCKPKKNPVNIWSWSHTGATVPPYTHLHCIMIPGFIHALLNASVHPFITLYTKYPELTPSIDVLSKQNTSCLGFTFKVAILPNYITGCNFFFFFFFSDDPVVKYLGLNKILILYIGSWFTFPFVYICDDIIRF